MDTAPGARHPHQLQQGCASAGATGVGQVGVEGCSPLAAVCEGIARVVLEL